MALGAGLLHGGAAPAYESAQLHSLLAGARQCRFCDLSGATLDGLDLSGADLFSGDLEQASLRGADLRGARLANVSLRGADFAGARLAGADLTLANLMAADLSRADLSGADLTTAWCDWRTRFPGLSVWRCAGVVTQRQPIWRAAWSFAWRLVLIAADRAVEARRWLDHCAARRIYCRRGDDPRQ